jgi:hypothetical protein
MIAKNEQIKFNLESLNFEVIRKVLLMLDVKWTDVDTGEKRIPNVNEISSVAEHCMREAFKSKSNKFSIGGFEAEVVGGVVDIKFVLAQAILSKHF